MTIEQKKISLINWITNFEDEIVLDQIADIQKLSLSDLPESIVQLLYKAASESIEISSVHTSAL
jgi:hypothetical protein